MVWVALGGWERWVRSRSVSLSAAQSGQCVYRVAIYQWRACCSSSLFTLCAEKRVDREVEPRFALAASFPAWRGGGQWVV